MEEWQEYTLAIYLNRGKKEIIELLKTLNSQNIVKFFDKLWEKYGKGYHREIMRKSDEYHKNITSGNGNGNNWNLRVKKKGKQGIPESLELFD